MKSINTKPEIALRKSLAELDLHYRLHRKDLPGTPDIAFIGKRLAVFVHGCYWHRHAKCSIGKPNRQVSLEWLARFNRIVKHDEEVQAKLKGMDWRWYIAWECKIQENPLKEAKKIATILSGR